MVGSLPVRSEDGRSGPISFKYKRPQHKCPFYYDEEWLNQTVIAEKVSLLLLVCCVVTESAVTKVFFGCFFFLAQQGQMSRKQIPGDVN